MMFNRRDQYGWMALLLHWLLFLLIAGLLAGGKYSASLPSGDKIGILIGAHKQIGMAVFLLMAFRLLWRIINTSVASSSSWLFGMLAFLMHWLLYIIVLMQAAIGVAMSQMARRDVVFFNFYELPSLADAGDRFLEIIAPLIPYFSAADAPAAHQMRALHEFVGDTMIVLIGLHIVVGLWHHFMIGDETMRRMSFRYTPDYVQKNAAEKKSRL